MAHGSVHHQGGVDDTGLQIHLLGLLQVGLLGHGAPVASRAERIVVVEAALADPVALLFFALGLVLLLASLAILRLDSGLLGGFNEHVLGLAVVVVGGLGLLAAVAVLAALEVVVLAFGALPAAIRELVVNIGPSLGLLGRTILGLWLRLNRHGRDGGDCLGRHPLWLGDEDTGREFAADLVLTNTGLIGRLDLADRANGIGRLADQDQGGQIFAQNVLDFLFIDGQQIRLHTLSVLLSLFAEVAELERSFIRWREIVI